MRDRWHLRKVVYTCTQAIANAYESGDEVDELIAKVEQSVLDIRKEHAIEDLLGIKQHVKDAVEKIETIFNNPNAM